VLPPGDNPTGVHSRGERRTTVDASRGIITCVTFLQECARVGPCTQGADSAPASTTTLASLNARDVYKEGCCCCYGPE
jgi:hypothetical protein